MDKKRKDKNFDLWLKLYVEVRVNRSHNRNWLKILYIIFKLLVYIVVNRYM